MYAQLIASYPIRCPKSVIHLSRDSIIIRVVLASQREVLCSIDRELPDSSHQVSDSSQADSTVIWAILVSHKEVLRPLCLVNCELPDSSP